MSSSACTLHPASINLRRKGHALGSCSAANPPLHRQRCQRQGFAARRTGALPVQASSFFDLGSLNFNPTDWLKVRTIHLALRRKGGSRAPPPLLAFCPPRGPGAAPSSHATPLRPAPQVPRHQAQLTLYPWMEAEMREQRMRAWLQKEVRQAAGGSPGAAGLPAGRSGPKPAAGTRPARRHRLVQCKAPFPAPLPACLQLCMSEGQARSVLQRCRGLAGLDVRHAARRLKQLDKQLGLSRGDAALAVLRRPHLLLPGPAEVVDYALAGRRTLRD